jgi:hypothetical protein
MKLFYRGHHYTPDTPAVSTIKQSFQGQFLGTSATLTARYRREAPDVQVPLVYRGKPYLSPR